MNKFKEKLNSYFSDLYTGEEKIILDLEPNKLLTHLRYDVIIKIMYVEFYLGITKSKLNKILYYLHLKRWKNFQGKDSNKYSYKDYELSFNETINSIKEGFDTSKTLIPIDKENKIIDGAHRLSASIVLKKKVGVIQFGSLAPSITLNRLDNFFNFKKNMYILDHLIIYYVKYFKNLRFIILFPVRNKTYDEKSISEIKKYGDIVLTKSISVGGMVSAFHMIKNFYFGAKWIGNLQDGFKGAAWKTQACFNNTNGVIDVLLFRPHKEEYVRTDHLKKVKENIRKIYNIHFHSIHSSDNYEENIRYSKLFFDKNSQKLLTKRPNIFYTKLESLIQKLNNNRIDHHNFVFSGSAVMGALGLREPNDFDVFYDESFSLPNDFSSHNNQIIHLHGYSINELIYNPKNYFFYMGYKFINLDIVLRLKINRFKLKPKTKDENDIKIIQEYLNSL